MKKYSSSRNNKYAKDTTSSSAMLYESVCHLKKLEGRYSLPSFCVCTGTWVAYDMCFNLFYLGVTGLS